MVDSDSDLDLGNSADEIEEEDHQNVEVFQTSDVLSKKNLITKSECSNLYTIQEEDEKEKDSKDKDRKKYSDISRLELYFKQLAESSNK